MQERFRSQMPSCLPAFLRSDHLQTELRCLSPFFSLQKFSAALRLCVFSFRIPGYDDCVHDLVVVGEAFDDLVFHGLERLPAPGEEIKTERFTRTVGGGVLITACAAARLGLPTHVISSLSPDGEAFLDREGISFMNLRRGEEPFALSVALSTGTDRAFVTFEGANVHLEERLLGRLESLEARHLHVALTPRDVPRWCSTLDAIRSRGTTVSWDVGWSPSLPDLASLVSHLDVFFCNEKEALLYSGTPLLEEAVRFWQTSARARLVIVKRGPRGCLWVRPDATGTAAAHAVEAVETTGAGDAFNGGYLHAFLTGASFETSLARANRVGALSTRRPGGIDGLPRREELD